jgi:hypothetical protein
MAARVQGAGKNSIEANKPTKKNSTSQKDGQKNANLPR